MEAAVVIAAPRRPRRAARMLAAAAAADGDAAAASSAPDQQQQQAQQPAKQRQPRQRRQPAEQQQQQQQQQQQEPWTYKYPHSRRGPSPCPPGDAFCRQLEALAQNVLGYPHAPPALVKRLEALRAAGIDQVTLAAERLAARYGSEIALHLICRAPAVLLADPDALEARARALAATVGAAGDAELLPLLHKAPALLLLEPGELRARYEALPRALRFTPQQAREIVAKYPLVLTKATPALAFMADKLRRLAAARPRWAAEAEALTPSLMAFILRDFGDVVSPPLFCCRPCSPFPRTLAPPPPFDRAARCALACLPPIKTL